MAQEKVRNGRDLIGSRQDMQQQIGALAEELSGLKAKLSAAEEKLLIQSEVAQASRNTRMLSFEASILCCITLL